MSKTVTIELPDDLAQQLGVSGNGGEGSLQKTVLHTLTMLAELMRSLQSDNPTVRAQAAKGLGDMGAETAVSALCRALKDNDLAVQKNTVEALQKIGTKEALGALAQYPSVRFDEATSTFVFDPLSALVGTLQSDVADLAENHDHYLAEELERELHFSD